MSIKTQFINYKLITIKTVSSQKYLIPFVEDDIFKNIKLKLTKILKYDKFYLICLRDNNIIYVNDNDKVINYISENNEFYLIKGIKKYGFI